MTSKARGLANLGNAYDDGALSNRNLIINGDFQVSQRGDYTSAFAPTNNAYYLDRWINSLNVVTGTLQDIGRKVKLVATSTGSGTFRILQKIELQTMNKFNNQTVTLSAKVKSNSAQARMGFYADGYLVPTGNATHTGDGTEQTLTAQITVPASTLTIEFDVFIGLQGASAGDNVSITSGDYVEITEVQLEVGDTATPFEHRSYGDELQRCMRYARLIGDGLAGNGVTAATWCASYVANPPMRASPTAYLTQTSIRISDHFYSDYNSSGSAMAFSNFSADGGRIGINGFSGMTIARWMSAWGNTNGTFVLLDAEL